MSKKQKPSALEEKAGISAPEHTHKNSIDKIKRKRKNKPSAEDLISGIKQGDIASLSRAITLVESRSKSDYSEADKIIKACLPFSNKSIRIGITGVPGVGKSTFIETFGKHLTSEGKKVAVLAVDPSSSLSKGSILGDKTRMEKLVTDPLAYIRPSASGDSLGGVARKTRESIILCEAAGYEIILVETVGVGQSETAVHSMVDFFLLLKIAGAGDELQGIKRGIIEMADTIVINKADGKNVDAAKRAKTEFSRALHLYPLKESGWKPEVRLCSALNREGIEDIWKLIEKYISEMTESSFLNKKRLDQQTYWMLSSIKERLNDDFFNRPEVKKELKNQLNLLSKNQTTAFAAAEVLLSL